MITQTSTYNKNNVSFGARLYDVSGMRIRAFDLMDCLKGIDKVSSKGSPKTDIFVNDIVSTKSIGWDYNNSVNCVVKNPLFEEQKINFDLVHKTLSPVDADDLYHMELLMNKSNGFVDLENMAMKKYLFSMMEESRGIITPIEILNKRLQTIGEEIHGFTADRLDKFKKIADDLLSDVINKGIKAINGNK